MSSYLYFIRNLEHRQVRIFCLILISISPIFIGVDLDEKVQGPSPYVSPISSAFPLRIWGGSTLAVYLKFTPMPTATAILKVGPTNWKCFRCPLLPCTCPHSCPSLRLPPLAQHVLSVPGRSDDDCSESPTIYLDPWNDLVFTDGFEVPSIDNLILLGQRY